MANNNTGTDVDIRHDRPRLLFASAEFKKAARRYGTWDRPPPESPPTRDARTGSTRPPRDWRRILYEALGQVLAERLMNPEGLRLAQKLYDHLTDGEEGPSDER